MQELSLELECRPTSTRCTLCQRAGAATEDEPGIAVLGMVTVAVPKDEKWKAFVDFRTKGKSRGFGDTITKGLKKIGVTQERVKRVKKKLTGDSGCGCSGRRNRLNEILPH